MDRQTDRQKAHRPYMSRFPSGARQKLIFIYAFSLTFWATWLKTIYHFHQIISSASDEPKLGVNASGCYIVMDLIYQQQQNCSARTLGTIYLVISATPHLYSSHPHQSTLYINNFLLHF